MPITFPRPPGFADVPDSSLAAEEFAVGSVIGRISENAAFGMVRPEVFIGTYIHGDTVALPVSPVDGYKYSRDELNYMWAVQTTTDVNTGWITAGFNGASLWFCQWFVNQSDGKVTCEEYYHRSEGRDAGKTNDGVLLVYTFASRRKNSLIVADQPYYDDVDDAELETDDALHETPLRDLNRNAKFSVLDCEAIYCGTFKHGQTVAAPASPVDGYQYSTSEITWVHSWVWTTYADQYTAPSGYSGLFGIGGIELEQFHRLIADVDASGHIWCQVYWRDHSATTLASLFGRIAVLALCRRGGGGTVVTQTDLGLAGLCGAFTDGSGNVIKPLDIGYGGTFIVPAGATKLQLGVNDENYSDNSGVGFDVTVTRSPDTWTGTVGPTVMPWNFTGGINSAYEFGEHDGADPVVIPLTFVAGESVTITYNSGTVKPFAGSSLAVDAWGYRGAITGSTNPGTEYYPTKYMTIGGTAPEFSIGGGVADNFAWIPPTNFKAGKPLKTDVMVQMDQNIREAVLRPEVFEMGDFENGDTVPLPTSSIDSYAYSRAECIYLWDMGDTNQPPGETWTDDRTIRVVGWSAQVSQATGLVTVKLARLRDGEKLRWYNDGILRVKIIAFRQSAAVTLNGDVSLSDSGTPSSGPDNSLPNGGMDSWSASGQTIADGWRPSGDEAGDYSYSEQPGISSVGSSQGITVTAGAGNQAGIRSARMAVYKGERYLELYRAKASAAITSRFHVRVKFWNPEANESVYVDLIDGALGADVDDRQIGVEIPANGATDIWTSLGTKSIVGTLDFEVGWISLEFHVIEPNVTTTVSIDDVKWQRANLDEQGNAVAATDPTDGDVLTWDATAKKWGPEAPGGGGTQPWTASIWFPDVASGRTVVVYVGGADYTVTFPAGLTNWKSSVGTNPSATKTYSFKKNGLEFGTLDVSSAGALTWTSASGSTIGNGDVLSIDEPTDSSLANVNITMKGTR